MELVKTSHTATGKRAVLFTVLLFFACDAVIKRSVTISRISAEPWYPFFMLTAFLLLAVCGAYLFVFFHTVKTEEWAKTVSEESNVRHSRLLFVLILLLGILLRFWKLDSLYDGIWFDEAYKGLDAIAIRVFGDRPLFLNWNAPREPMVAYLVAASTFFFGYSIFAIRAVEALAGSLTLIFAYLFAKKIFGTRIALWTMFLLAVSKQHLIYSRLGYRICLFVLFELLTLFLLASALLSRRNKIWLFILAGISAGAGFYTYVSYRTFPLVLLAFLFDPVIRKGARERISGVAISIVFCAAVTAPLALYFVKHPETFTYRMQSAGVWNNQSESIPHLLFKTGTATLGIFNFIGDPFPRQNVNAEQELSPFLTGFFLVGIIFSAANIRKPFASFLLLYLAIGLLPTVFSLPNPHAGRTLGALPPALIITTLGLFAVLQILWSAASFLVRPVLLIVIGGSMLTGPNDALFRYSNYLDSYDADAGMNRLEYNIAQLVQTGGEKCQYYLSPQFFFHASIEYLSYPRPPYKLFNNHTRFDPDKISIIVVYTEPRLLWWLTDNEGKNFFKWWHQYYGWSIADIRKWNSEMYDLPPKLPQSDAPALERLKQQYPGGRVVKLDYFSLFVFKSNTFSEELR